MGLRPKGAWKMAKHPKRRTSPPVTKQFRIKLRPGDRIVTPTVIIRARQGVGGGGVGTTVSVTCECKKAEPNMPDCTPQTSSPDGHTTTVKCVKSGGCKKCESSITTTTTSVIMA
jgi:hypothetical protein